MLQVMQNLYVKELSLNTCDIPTVEGSSHTVVGPLGLQGLLRAREVKAIFMRRRLSLSFPSPCSFHLLLSVRWSFPEAT